MERKAKLFKIVSRILLFSTFALAWYVPPVHASTVTCEEDNNVWDCSLDVDSETGIDITFTLQQASNVSFTTYTSLTCDDHGSDEGTGAYAADPYIYLYDDSDVLLFQDDDSASHNDGTNMCWDSHIAVTNLAAGDYRLNANVYEDVFGVYSMDISGVVSVDNQPPATTTTTTSTTTSTTTTSTTTTSTTSTTTTTTSTTTTTEPPPPETTTTTTTSTTTTTTLPPTTLPPTTTLPPPTTTFIDFEEFDDWFEFEEIEIEEEEVVEFDLDAWLEEFEEEEEIVFEEEEEIIFEEEPEEEVIEIEDVFTEEQLEELDEEEIIILTEELEMLSDTDLEAEEIEELVEDLEEIFDDEPVTEEEIQDLTEDVEAFEELSVEAREEVVEIINEASDEVREEFEENVDVFSDVAYGEFVQTGSRITVEDRQVIIVASAAVTAAGATRIKPMASPGTPSAGPTSSGPSNRGSRRRS